MKKKGRPSIYSKEIADLICDGLASGRSLRSICRDGNMPDERSVRRWALDNVGGFMPQYTHARDIGLDAMADEMLDIADTPVGSTDNGSTDSGGVAKQRLQVDTRKWYLSKLAPKKYGDKASMELTGADGGPVQISDTLRAAKISAILASAKARAEGEQPDTV